MIFSDFLEMESLYDKPRFGDCIWTDNHERIIFAWLSLSFREKLVNMLKQFICRAFPQPPRHNGIPITIKIKAQYGKIIEGLDHIIWEEEEKLKEPQIKENINLKINKWGDDIIEEYIKDVRVLSGEDEAVYPISGKRTYFAHKNNADELNRLDEIMCYLEEKYAVLGISTHREEFIWRGMKQGNIIATLPGKGKQHSLKPIIIADHFDTAFCQDIYEETKKRMSTPGADDNSVATAVLLMAAKILLHSEFEHDVVLLHLTGEEFPGDDLGARHFISNLLLHKKDIGGIIIMDMIGWRKPDDFIYQINTGIDKESKKIGDLALEVSKLISKKWEGTIRHIWDPKSYLQNTDGIIFSDAGYPVIVLNEHINGIENIDREGYHDTKDVISNVDFDLATNIGKVAIETAFQLALKK